MKGRRVHIFFDVDILSFKPGDYGYDRTVGIWYCCAPIEFDTSLGKETLLGNLTNHQVTEHEDGTITVSPSILIRRGPDMSWHGYLEKGVWRSV